jgi:hypothetical protein
VRDGGESVKGKWRERRRFGGCLKVKRRRRGCEDDDDDEWVCKMS